MQKYECLFNDHHRFRLDDAVHIQAVEVLTIAKTTCIEADRMFAAAEQRFDRRGDQFAARIEDLETDSRRLRKPEGDGRLILYGIREVLVEHKDAIDLLRTHR